MNDFYSILEVSPNASKEVIEAAFKTLMLKYHPDKNSSTEKKAKEISEAHTVLSNTASRKKYDRKRASENVGSLGQYRVIEKIAEGGFGTTYRGEHIRLDTPVCIKHASSVSAEDERILIEEATAIWDLRHYAIPSIRDIIKLDDGSLALIMSYIPGPTLDQIIEKNKYLDAEHVCWITERILNALRYLHFHGVIHGDIKPGNIIIQPEEHMVSLVDYGLSLIRPLDSDKSKGYTPFFAPPEQVKGYTLLPESDLYSLGMTMIYALGGDVRKKDVPKNTPDQLCKFIKKLIVRDVLSRPKWDVDLISELRDIRLKTFKRSSSFGMKIPGF